jgi:hypothetical protein
MAVNMRRYRVELVCESGAYEPEEVTLRTSTDVANLLRPIFAGADREKFVVALLDAKHRAIGINVVSVGSLTASIVAGREVFKAAIAGNSVDLGVSGSKEKRPALDKLMADATAYAGEPIDFVQDHLGHRNIESSFTLACRIGDGARRSAGSSGPGRSHCRVSSNGSFLLILEVHPYVLFSPFSGSSPEASMPPAGTAQCRAADRSLSNEQYSTIAA